MPNTSTSTSRFFASALCALFALGAGSAIAQTTKKGAPVVVAAVTAPAAALTSEQLAIAQIVHTGRIACDQGQHVTVTPDAKRPGAFDLSFGSQRFDVVPVPSKTGAIRLENAQAGIVYMQLANKSMLLNEKQGRRLADECMSQSQHAVAAQMKSQGAPSILDGPSK